MATSHEVVGAMGAVKSAEHRLLTDITACKAVQCIVIAAFSAMDSVKVDEAIRVHRTGSGRSWVRERNVIAAKVVASIHVPLVLLWYTVVWVWVQRLPHGVSNPREVHLPNFGLYVEDFLVEIMLARARVAVSANSKVLLDSPVDKRPV